MGAVRDLKFKSAKSRRGAGWKCFWATNSLPMTLARRGSIANFQQNLRDILKRGLEFGCACHAEYSGCQLKDCSPFASIPPGGSNAVSPAQFEKAAQLHPHSADLQYGWAKCLWNMTNYAARPRNIFKRPAIATRSLFAPTPGSMI